MLEGVGNGARAKMNVVLDSAANNCSAWASLAGRMRQGSAGAANSHIRQALPPVEG